MATESPEARRARRLAARDERNKLAAEGKKKSRQQRLVLFGGGGVVLLALLGLLGFNLTQSMSVGSPGQLLPEEGRNHVKIGDLPTYKTNPPASGAHYEQWIARGGFFQDPQDPGLWIHNLEHGYIVILYNCPMECPQLVADLRAFYESVPPVKGFSYNKIVVTPYKEMPQRLVALAWTRMEEYSELNRDRLMNFYRAYVDKGPERGAG